MRRRDGGVKQEEGRGRPPANATSGAIAHGCVEFARWVRVNTDSRAGRGRVVVFARLRSPTAHAPPALAAHRPTATGGARPTRNHRPLTPSAASVTLPRGR